MSWFWWLLLIAYVALSLVGGFIGMLYLLELIDYPRSEEGWRIELYNTTGLERDTIITSYRFHHRKRIRELKRKKREDAKKEQSTPWQAVAGSQGLYARNGASSGQADSRVGGYNEKPGHDDDYHELPRRGDPGAPDRTFQDAPQGAGSEASAPSSRPAHESGKNWPSESEDGSTKSVALQAGSGRRAGSMIDDFDSPFWKKLVENGERLGL